MHIAFNMFALYQVGTFVELIYGTPRMAIIYIARRDRRRRRA